MRNFLISLLVAIIVFFGFYLSRIFTPLQASAPAILAMLVAYWVLMQKTRKKVEPLIEKSALAARNGKPDLAVKTLEQGYPLASHQWGIKTQLDAQIGIVYFLYQKFDQAMPYLEKAMTFSHWMASAMLSVIYYKKKRNQDMKKSLELATKRGKKQSLAWSLRAYLLSQAGEKDEAMKVLNDGLKVLPEDEKMKAALLALQNGKKIKMKAYKEQWYQFHLERPPAQMAMGQGPRPKISKAQRRGR